MTNPFETLRDMGDKAPLFYAISTGAGAGIQKLVWEIPGVSNFFAGASFPYAMEETNSLLGFTPDLSPRGKPEYVSVNTAIDLAMTSYMRAWKPGRKAVGLGMTCSVASKTAHVHGDHRILVALFSDEGCWTLSAVIPKGAGNEQRAADGALADHIATEFFGWYIGTREEGLNFYGCTVKLDGANDLARERVLAHPYFKADGTRGTLADIDPSETVFFPGAFNPPHKGHTDSALVSLKMMADKEREYRKLVFSTTVNPPHKAALTTAEMLQRAKMMKGCDFLLTEGDPLFINKARKFPGAYFIMGADAMDRMLDEKWGEPVRPMLDEFKGLGTRFLVPGRVSPTSDGPEYLTCNNVMGKHMPVVLGCSLLFIPVNFRLDLSSTELRAKANGTPSERVQDSPAAILTEARETQALGCPLPADGQ